jgi:hypothetical protein
MSGYIGKGKSVVNVESYTKTQANATFLTPTGNGSQLTGISGSATDIVAFSTDPSVGSAGKIYYNTTSKVLRTSDGTAWVDVSNTSAEITGGTVTLTSTNEGASFSYNLGANFTDAATSDTALTYALASGTLPTGLTLPSSGSSALAGTLGGISASTAYSFAITATDAGGLTSAPQSYSMTVLKVNVAATGGTITTSGSYTVHTFNSSGTFTPSSSGNVEYVIVAGGAAGGIGHGGGGGAGGYLQKVVGETYNSVAGAHVPVTAQAYTVTVGGGGAKTNYTGGTVSLSNAGSNSVFNSLTAIGGGAASGYGGGRGGASGGSGGGSGGTTTSIYYGGSGTSGQGKNGGTSAYWTGGGGGGATGIGGNAAYQAAGGTGGAGFSSSINGSSTGRAGGGGGGVHPQSQGGSASSGGGSGNGSSNQFNSTKAASYGTANTGGGGGGGGGSYAPGGSGGSGLVIIRYLT